MDKINEKFKFFSKILVFKNDFVQHSMGNPTKSWIYSVQIIRAALYKKNFVFKDLKVLFLSENASFHHLNGLFKTSEILRNS